MPEASTGAPDDGETEGGGEPVAPTYQHVQQKSSHNSYARHEALIDQLLYHRLRSLELDIHRAEAGQWFVYHDAYDTKTTCVRLSDCLRDIGALVEAVPDHEVLTLWIDLKQDWDESHTPADLDVLLDEAFGPEILTPGELLEGCPEAVDLHDAVTTCGWPELDALRGRVVVMLTGGNLDESQGKLGTYLSQGELGFVAPSVETGDDVAKPAHGDVAVLNVESGWEVGAQAGLKAGYVIRIWGLNDEPHWKTAAQLGVHHLATDKVNLHQDPWARTHDELGWPFTCLDGCYADPLPEPGNVIGIEVESGDLWGSSDDGWFQLVEVAPDEPGADETWTTLVSTPNSHVEPFAKGCLMARVGLEPDAPNFAVCRPADEEPLRVQIRAGRGEATQAIENDVVDAGTVAPSSAAWIRLELYDGGRCARGFGAHRRDEWIPIAEHCFEQPLRFRGLAASSHDAGKVRLLFVAPTRFSSAAHVMTSTDFDQGRAMGGAQAEVFDDPIP